MINITVFKSKLVNISLDSFYHLLFVLGNDALDIHPCPFYRLDHFQAN